MPTLKLTLCFLFLLLTLSFAQKTFYVIPNADNVGLYANRTRQMNEKSLATAGKSDHLRVVETKRKHYRVRLGNGAEGWVEKRLVTQSEAKAYTFDDVEIEGGYLDNPTPIYITDVDESESIPIELDRSFADALKSNTNKEQINRTIR